MEMTSSQRILIDELSELERKRAQDLEEEIERKKQAVINAMNDVSPAGAAARSSAILMNTRIIGDVHADVKDVKRDVKSIKASVETGVASTIYIPFIGRQPSGYVFALACVIVLVVGWILNNAVDKGKSRELAEAVQILRGQAARADERVIEVANGKNRNNGTDVSN
jgi:hypothetical protein